jgi:hypothetical protein
MADEPPSDSLTARQRAALLDPLAGDDPDAVNRRRVSVDIGDGALLTTILAVDR